jgi:hypothetical protein
MFPFKWSSRFEISVRIDEIFLVQLRLSERSICDRLILQRTIRNEFDEKGASLMTALPWSECFQKDQALLPNRPDGAGQSSPPEKVESTDQLKRTASYPLTINELRLFYSHKLSSAKSNYWRKPEHKTDHGSVRLALTGCQSKLVRCFFSFAQYRDARISNHNSAEYVVACVLMSPLIPGICALWIRSQAQRMCVISMHNKVAFRPASCDISMHSNHRAIDQPVHTCFAFQKWSTLTCSHS